VEDPRTVQILVGDLKPTWDSARQGASPASMELAGILLQVELVDLKQCQGDSIPTLKGILIQEHSWAPKTTSMAPPQTALR